MCVDGCVCAWVSVVSMCGVEGIFSEKRACLADVCLSKVGCGW